MYDRGVQDELDPEVGLASEATKVIDGYKPMLK